MKKTTFLYLVISALVALCTTNIFASDWIDNIPYSKDISYSSNDISDGYIYLLYDNQINIEREEEYLRSAIKVTSNSGLAEASSININYDQSYQSLKYNFVHVIRNNKTIDVLKLQQPETIRRETRLESGIIDGRLTSFLEILDVRVGDIIEYAYTIKGFNPIQEGLFRKTYNLNYSAPIGKRHLKLCTNNPHVNNYTLLNNAPEPRVNKEGNTSSYSWEVLNPEIVNYENDAPVWYNPYQQVILASDVSWNAVCQHISKLYSSNNKLDSDIQSYIQDVKKKYSNNEDCATEILRFVQNDIRYLGNENGIYSYKPRHPNLTFEKKAGDCKEKAWLLSSMLKQIGYDAYPCLVNTFNGKNINTLPAGYESFDHCITSVLLENDTIFLDPTISDQGGTFTSTLIPDYGYALIIKDGVDELCEIKYNGYYDVFVHEQFTIDDYSGKASLDVTTTYKGQSAEDTRSQLNNSSIKDIQDNYIQFYANSYLHIDTLKILTFTDDKINNIIKVHEQYEIDNIWELEDSISQKHIAYFGAYSLNYEIDRVAYPGRKSPALNTFPFHYQQVVTINLPEEWDIKNSTNEIKGPGFKYINRVDKIKNSIILSYNYQTTSDIIKPQDYLNFIEKTEQVEYDLSYGIIRYGSSTSQQDPRLNFQFIIIAIFVLIIGIYLAIKVYRFDLVSTRNSTQDQGIGGWLVLIAIGVTITPFLMVYQIIDTNYFEAGIWEHIYNPNSSDYSLGVGILIIVEMLFNILFAIFATLNAILLFQRRSIFPNVFIAYLILNFLFICLDYIVLSHYHYGEFDIDTISDIVKRIIYMAIWIPYLMMSERVKNTFVKQLKPIKIKD